MQQNTRNIKNSRKLWLFWLAFALSAATLAAPAFTSEPVSLGGLNPGSTKTGSLYPEGVEYNANTGNFLLGSFREGVVYEVEQDGTHRILVKDKRLITVMGIRIDAKRNRLFVANSDLGVSVRKSSKGTKKLASLGIYELSTGKALNFIDLGALRPEGEQHIANDLALDFEGNVYITDSLAPVIYKVDTRGKASVFLENKSRFSGKGFNLNGIVTHPDGYLIVAKKNDGALFKVPLAHPEKFLEIKTPRKLIGADGLVLVNNGNLVVITNRASGILSDTVFALSSTDNWNSADITGDYKFTKDEYPTTGVLKDEKIYVVHGRVNTLMTSPKAEKATGYTQQSTIQQVGSIAR